MREIKFRAWDKIIGCWSDDPSNSLAEISIKLNGHVSILDDCGTYRPNDYIIEQFTGIRGKNGKEIYEGDIIQVHHVRLVSDGPVHKPRVAEIKWLDDDCGFRLVGAEVRSTNPDIYPTSHLEVIGNIHENPELLKGQNSGD